MAEKTIAVVAGTRPEVIKMAPVYFSLQESAEFRPIWISTGQHREMLRQAASAFGIEADLDLDLMQPGQDLTGLTARVLTSMGAALRELQPSAVLVQGDTTSVLGTAMASFYAGIPVGHVEAGLRTRDMGSPWPEEMNRRLTDPLCQWCFAPTSGSAENLLAEQIPEDRVFVTGNTVIDALLWTRRRLKESGTTAEAIAAECGISDHFRDRFLAKASTRWILVTGHRRESFGAGFEELCTAIHCLAQQFPDIGILYPVHLNPKVREPVNRILADHERIELIEPVGYQSFVWLMDHCHFLLSDSGGVQEEAPSLGKPVLVTRATTERPEGVAAGTCRLVGTNPDQILAEAEVLLSSEEDYEDRCTIQNPYGDGNAADRIRGILDSSKL